MIFMGRTRRVRIARRRPLPRITGVEAGAAGESHARPDRRAADGKAPGTQPVDSGFGEMRGSGPAAERPTRAGPQVLHDQAARREWHEVRAEAAALRAESPHTRRRAAEMRREANALLDAVVAM